MVDKVRVAIDAHGGDNAPGEIIKGCCMALKQHKDVELFITGNQHQVESIISEHGADHSRIKLVHTTQIIEMAESPVEAIKHKKDSSLVVALQALAQGEADVLISAGSTGAVLAGSTLIVRRIKGVKRPALAPLLPTAKSKPVLLIDCGANADCKPSFLAQFGVMGSLYMQRVQGIPAPRVALVNNGAEAEKGSELTKEAYKLLEKMPIDFVGNVEAREINSGDIDVVVCDGFVGNVVLKLTEGLAGTLMGMLKDEFTSSTRGKLGAAMLMPAFKNFKRKMDYHEYGGAPFLGVDGGVIKAHGSSKAKSIAAAITQARDLKRGKVIESIREGIADMSLED